MAKKTSSKNLSEEEGELLLETLQERFEANMERHPDVTWKAVRKKLLAAPDKLWSLQEMESSGGEPDVVSFQAEKGFVFYDCCPESPRGRRSLCYDAAALESRKANKPKGSATEMAQAMGIELLDEARYQALQGTGEFDRKTSSWLATPEEVRELGGAIFGDRRFGRVFIYHNGAESYYTARGFRGYLEL